MIINSIYVMNDSKIKHPPNRLALIRENEKLSPEELAELMGVDKESIRRYEACGTPKESRGLTHELMIALASALKCEPYELIVDKEDIIRREAMYIAEHRKIIDAYLRLDRKDKDLVDRFLFPEKKTYAGDRIPENNGHNGTNGYKKA